MRRLHIVDGTYELFRAHFSRRPPHRAPDGRDAKATAGLCGSLLALLHDEAEAVSHLAVAFDNPIRSFRNGLFDGYKTGEGVPEELLAQFDLAEEATRALGIRAWSMDRWEADDALCTAAHRFKARVDQVRIVACDKDLMQCVEGDRVVLVDKVRDRVVDAPGVRALKGVVPARIPDLLALVGDAADGIPGLPGFGEKSAAAVLAAFGPLEEIPGDVARWPKALRGAPRLCATFADRREDALLYRTLATLVTDAEIDDSLDALAFRGVPGQDWRAFCGKLGLTTLAQRPRRWSA